MSTNKCSCGLTRSPSTNFQVTHKLHCRQSARHVPDCQWRVRRSESGATVPHDTTSFARNHSGQRQSLLPLRDLERSLHRSRCDSDKRHQSRTRTPQAALSRRLYHTATTSANLLLQRWPRAFSFICPETCIAGAVDSYSPILHLLTLLFLYWHCTTALQPLPAGIVDEPTFQLSLYHTRCLIVCSIIW